MLLGTIDRSVQARLVAGYSQPRRAPACRLASGLDIVHYLQEEVTIEGVLHVSAAQAGSCMERFGDLDALPAPALPSLDDVLASTGHAAHSAGTGSASHVMAAAQSPAPPNSTKASSLNERVVKEAFCLATPPDNPAEGNSSPMRSLTGDPEEAELSSRSVSSRLQAARTNSGTPYGTQAEQELLQLEAAAYQRAALSTQALYTHEMLCAADARRRQRRAALLRLVRSGRTLTNNSLSALQATPPAQLLATISSSISSVASWDDDSAGTSSGGGNAGSSDLAHWRAESAQSAQANSSASPTDDSTNSAMGSAGIAKDT